MTIPVRCGKCERSLRAPDKAAGKTLKCPDCGTDVEIPATKPDSKGAYSLKDVTQGVPTPTRCWECNAEVQTNDLDCPECGASLKTTTALQPPVVTRKKRRKKTRQDEAANKWRESPSGAFAYAFLAVLRGKGWICCLWCAAMMTVLPIIPAFVGLPLICIPIIGAMLYFAIMFIIIAAAPAGLLSRNMEVASRNGAREEIEHWEMSLFDEMIPASIELLKANAVLGLLPLVIAGVFASMFGAFTSFTPGSLETIGEVGSVLTGLMYLGIALACSFCGPMCIMLLGAAGIEDAVYPPNVFKVIRSTFPQYVAFYCYIVVLAVTTYIVATVLAAIVLMIFGSVATAWESGGALSNTLFVLACAVAWSVVCLFMTYFSAVVGWSMGIFVFRNYEHFEVVTD